MNGMLFTKKRSGALVFALVSLLLLTPLTAATPFTAWAAANNVTVYLSNIKPTGSNPVTLSGVTTVADAYNEAAAVPYDSSVIYTLNGVFGQENAEKQTLADGDLVEFYEVTPSPPDYDYSTWFYATADPTTAVVVDGRIKALQDERFQYGELVGFDFLAPTEYRENAVTFSAAAGGIVASAAISGLTVLDSYLPVDIVADYTDYGDEITAQLSLLLSSAYAYLGSNELTSAGVGLLDDLIATAEGAATPDAKAAAMKDLGAFFHDADYREKDARPQLVWFGDDVAATVPYDPDLSYYAGENPDPFTYTIAPTDGSTFAGRTLTIHVWTKPGMSYTVTADNDATVDSNQVIVFGANGITTITLSTMMSGSQPRAQRTYKFAIDRNAPTPPTDVNPYAVDGYLPLGQFSSGRGWGSISNDDKNSLDYSPYETYEQTVKGIDGYTGTGVSLGVAGGYVQYEFDDNHPLENDPDNPYGVDFIVYGNAFDGFGEAGAAQVSEDGTIWYDLAGSLYYRDDANTLTQNNVDVGYKIEDGAIQYKVTASDGKILHDWDTLIDSAGWWPTVAKNYPNVAGADAARPYASTPVTGVYYDPAGLITHERRTLVDGVTINKRFAFGYADTHANSESYDYGVAINPYLNAMGGGDGFDLSWAVDENGAPVSLSEVKYVRIYTASVLDTEKSTPENPVFTLGGFGDISTEVCGLYRTINTGSGVFTPAATVSYGSSTYTTSPVSNTQGITNVTLPATASSRTYTIDSLSAGNAYINSEKMTAATQTLTVTLARGQTALYRIITQSADGNAYVNLVRFTRL